MDRWEPFQIAAAFAGYVQANSPPKSRHPTEEEFRTNVARAMETMH